MHNNQNNRRFEAFEQTDLSMRTHLHTASKPLNIYFSSQSESKRRVRGLMSTNSSSDEFDEDPKPPRAKEPIIRRPGVSPDNEDEEEDDDDDDDSEEEETDDDDDEPGPAPEGAYDPADYANLPVSTEIKELFQYITR